jgi:hypothetical protein
LDEAKAKLAKRFKLKPEAVERLFSGGSVTIKKRVDESTAKKVQQAAASCGVIFDLVPIADPTAAATAPPAAAAEPKTNLETCPHCGLSQRRSTTCIQCGEFLIRSQKRSGETAPAEAAAPALVSESASRPFKKIWKTARIGLLLLILVVVGIDSIMTGRWTTDWDDPLWVGIYPINGDQLAHINNYIDNLEETDFVPIADFFSDEAEAYGLPLAQPFTIRLAPAVDNLPPSPPHGRNPLKVMWWSLKMRLWAYQNDTFTDGPSPDIKIFIVYHDDDTSQPLENSLGIRKGLFGIVHAYANYRLEKKNQVVIAHEILHTVGAKDKYDLETKQPIYPSGYADPDNRPLFPQRFAEIMGSRIPLSKTQSEMPPSLNYTVIGEKTASEIKWIDLSGKT